MIRALTISIPLAIASTALAHERGFSWPPFENGDVEVCEEHVGCSFISEREFRQEFPEWARQYTHDQWVEAAQAPIIDGVTGEPLWTLHPPIPRANPRR